MRGFQILLSVPAAVAAVLAAASPAVASGLCDGTPYVVGDGPTTLYAVATDPVALLDRGDLTLDGQPITVNAAAIRSTDGLLYGWDDTHWQLVTVDADLTVSPLPTPPLPVGPRQPVYLAGEISPDGDSYYLFSLLDTDTLFVVDLTMSPASLTYSTVALSEAIQVSDFALHPTSGLLYGEQFGDLVRIDPQSGDIVRSELDFGSEPPFQLGAVWFDPGGALFGLRNSDGMGRSQLWRIDVETLDTTLLGTGPELVSTDGAICHDDSDGDGVADGGDLCSGTAVPEQVPTVRLGVNRFALTDDSGVFSTRSPPGRGPRRSYTIEETAGCSCEQIIFLLELGQGHRKHGCSISAMDEWVASVPLLP